MTLEAITAANHAGETFGATIIQPVIVNGVQLIRAQTPVTMEMGALLRPVRYQPQRMR
jgi:hypothetical protein